MDGSSENSVCNLEKEPSTTWTVAELRRFLKERGGRLAGKKSDLVERYAIGFFIFFFWRIFTDLSPKLVLSVSDPLPTKMKKNDDNCDISD